MKFATKAAARAKRLRRRARRRLTISGLCILLILGGASWPFVNGLRNDFSSYSKGSTTTITTGKPMIGGPLSFAKTGNSATNGQTLKNTSANVPKTTSIITQTGITARPLQLSVAPSSTTVYINTTNAQGVKAGVLTTSEVIWADSGQAIEQPTISNNPGFTVWSSANATKTSWTMNISAPGMSPGLHMVNVVASTTTGDTYSGALAIDIVSIPSFSATSSATTAQVQQGTTDTADFSGLAYSPTANTPRPGITVKTLSGTTIPCSSGLSYTSSTVTCSDPAILGLSDGTTIVEFTLDNEFQDFVVSGDLIVSN